MGAGREHPVRRRGGAGRGAGVAAPGGRRRAGGVAAPAAVGGRLPCRPAVAGRLRRVDLRPGQDPRRAPGAATGGGKCIGRAPRAAARPRARGAAGVVRGGPARAAAALAPAAPGHRGGDRPAGGGAARGIVPFVVELREWRTPCFRTEVVYFTPRQQPHRRAGPARPRRRPGSAGRGSPAPAGSAAPPPPARSPPSVESSGRRATA